MKEAAAGRKGLPEGEEGPTLKKFPESSLKGQRLPQARLVLQLLPNVGGARRDAADRRQTAAGFPPGEGGRPGARGPARRRPKPEAESGSRAKGGRRNGAEASRRSRTEGELAGS